MTDAELLDQALQELDDWKAQAEAMEAAAVAQARRTLQWMDSYHKMTNACRDENARADAAEARVTELERQRDETVAEVKRRHVTFPEANLDELADEIEEGRV